MSRAKKLVKARILTLTEEKNQRIVSVISNASVNRSTMVPIVRFSRPVPIKLRHISTTARKFAAEEVGTALPATMVQRGRRRTPLARIFRAVRNW